MAHRQATSPIEREEIEEADQEARTAAAAGQHKTVEDKSQVVVGSWEVIAVMKAAGYKLFAELPMNLRTYAEMMASVMGALVATEMEAADFMKCNALGLPSWRRLRPIDPNCPYMP